ncbi:hypothetical protein Dimus_023923 [Dionaea muscipula]
MSSFQRYNLDESFSMSLIFISVSCNLVIGDWIVGDFYIDWFDVCNLGYNVEKITACPFNIYWVELQFGLSFGELYELQFRLSIELFPLLFPLIFTSCTNIKSW